MACAYASVSPHSTPSSIRVCMSPAPTPRTPTTNTGSTHLSSFGLQQPRNHDSFINDNVNLYLCLGLWCTQDSRHCFFPKVSGLTAASGGRVGWHHTCLAHSQSFSLRRSTPHPRGHHRLYHTPLALLLDLGQATFTEFTCIAWFSESQGARQSCHT